MTRNCQQNLGILALLEAEKIELVNSDALTFEINRAPSPVRRRFAQETLRGAKIYVILGDVATRSRVFVDYGIKPLDALHLASAEFAGTMYFCTCDDKLLRRARTILDLSCKVVSPAELVEELE